MSSSQSTDRVALLSCSSCQSPVIKGSGPCRSCGTPQSGKEFAYISQAGSGRELGPLFKWWGIWSAVIWVFSGFALGTTTSLLLTGVALFYLIRILRAYYSD
jgi:hypothetical protein